MSEPTKEELQARIAESEKQSGSKKIGKLEFRVGAKGGVSVYGLGRFPVTLYYEQWIRLLDAAGELSAFLEGNKSRLKLKNETGTGGYRLPLMIEDGVSHGQQMRSIRINMPGCAG